MKEASTEHIYSYGELLGRLLKEYGVSVSNLRLKLKLSSRTTIVRIINGECRPNTVERFHRLITAHRVLLPFTDGDLDALSAALEITCSGKLTALINRGLRDLISGKGRSGTAGNDGSDEHKDKLARLFGDYRSCDKAHICIVNCCTEAVIDSLISLKRLLSDEDAKRYEIRHFLSGKSRDGSGIGRLLRLSPLLTWECYRAVCPAGAASRSDAPESLEKSGSDEPFGSLTNYIIVLCERDGRVSADLIHPLDPENPTGVFGIGDERLCGYLRQFFDSMERRGDAVNMVLGVSVSPDMSALDAGSRLLEDAEQSWQTILLKPDICINQLSPDIVRRVLNDSPVPLDPTALEALLEVQRRRYENYLDPSRHEVIILSRSGLERFAETGILSDHPVGAVPLERQEIIRALTDLLEAERHIGGFYVYVSEISIGCSIKLCGDDMLFISEVDSPSGFGLIRSAAVVGMLTDYIFSRFIPESSMSREDSRKFIAGLIAKLREPVCE